jgi:hypothetical protein
VTDVPPYVHVLGPTRSPAFTFRRLLPAWEPPWQPMRGPVPAGERCASCEFEPLLRVPSPGFPLPPFELAEPMGERRPYRVEFYGIGQVPRAWLSSII